MPYTEHYHQQLFYSYSNSTGRITLSTDASDGQNGCLVLQKHETYMARSIGYQFHTLNDREKDTKIRKENAKQ